MPLPTPELTWEYNVNQTMSVGGTALENYRTMWYTIKQNMTSFVNFPWTVVSSSNGTTASGSDLWINTGSLVAAGSDTSAHSWIVLKNTGLASNYQVLFDYAAGGNPNTNGQRMRVIVSPSAGFGSGTTTSRPTATDEQVLLSGNTGGIYNSPFPFETTSPWQGVFHAMQATDGSSLRIIICYGNQTPGWLFFSKVTDAPAAWSPAVIASVATANSQTTSVQTYANYWDGLSIGGRITGTNVTLYATGEGCVSNAVGENIPTANELDNSYPIMPMGVMQTTSVGRRGRHGRLKDIWWGQSSSPPAFSGVTYPADNSRQFIQFGHMIFPWNGTTPIVG